MKNAQPARVRFGVFELDLKSGELRHGANRILLQEQPLQILCMLVEREGEVVPREEIRKRLWPNDTIVDFDHSINAAIRNLRRMLGDSADEPQYIETLARRGYRLMVGVEWLAVAEHGPAQIDAQGAGDDGAATRIALQPPVLSGQMVSHYRVLDIIGGGGMGVVYRAEDLKLGRQVALKFLPEEMGNDPQALERFSREARAASSLDHPNICAIYEFGEHEGKPFIVMQLLEGQTLREYLGELASDHAALPLERLLEIATQIADGLEAAHEKGIVHRDVKPANVFITNRGVVKILDFGVAKLQERPDEVEVATQVDALPADSGALHLTRTGIRIGTAGYMSPEQVRGEKLDARTDIFSLGLVLYEMATGQRAFSGETAMVLHEAILNQAPVAVRDLNPVLPQKIVAIIDKCLQKERGERYQSAAEIRDALEEVRNETEMAHRRTAPSAPPARATSSGTTLSRKLIFAIAAVALLIWVGERVADRRTAASGGARHFRVVPITSLPGAVGTPALSPDGKQVAFFWEPEGREVGDWAGLIQEKSGLYIQLVSGSEPLRLTNPKGGFVGHAAWSPDGREIAFGRCDDDGGAIYTVSALGGPEHKVTDVICMFGGGGGGVNWTPDGKALVLVDRCGSEQIGAIVVFSSETGQKHCITAPPPGSVTDLSPVLSPDGQTLAFIRMSTSGDGDIYTVPLAGGEARRLTHENRNPWQLMWSADGRSIIFLSNQNGIDGLRRIPAQGGPIQLESEYPGVGSLTKDGSRLAYVQPQAFWASSTSIWRADLARVGGGVQRTQQIASSNTLNSAPQVSPDGNFVVFESERSSTVEIWKCNADGSDPVQLTSFGGNAGTPRWSPDGRWIVFDYQPHEHSEIWVMDPDGRNAHAVISGASDNVVPSWTRDGKAILFASNRTSQYEVWAHDLETGRESRITTKGGFASFESPDSKSVFYTRVDGAGIWTVPRNGGSETRLTAAPHLGYWGDFAVTDEGIYFLDSDAPRGPTIEYYTFQTKAIKKVFTLANGQSAIPWVANLGVSRDGRRIYFAQGTTKSSIVMAEFHP
jgi:serine/threonine protein kinase/Tol biopolymer transport system component